MLTFQALVDLVNKINESVLPTKTGKRMYTTSGSVQVKGDSALTSSAGGATKPKDERPFDGMNNVVANLLLNMTR